MAFYNPKWASSQAECDVKWPGTQIIGIGTRDAQCVEATSYPVLLDGGPPVGLSQPAASPASPASTGWYWLIGAGALVVAAVIVGGKSKPLSGVRGQRRTRRRRK